MKNTAIIIANPSSDSFSKSIENYVSKALKDRDKPYEIIDLYNDNFNPVMTKEEVDLYSNGSSKDELVKKYQHIIKSTDEIVFIFPIWWNSAPAILKGFFDKVFIKEFAFIEENKRPKGILTNITSGLVITTSETDTEYIKEELDNPIEKGFIKGILNVSGMKNIKWINNNLAEDNENSKIEFINSIKNYL